VGCAISSTQGVYGEAMPATSSGGKIAIEAQRHTVVQG
jgi:hypothetical protein